MITLSLYHQDDPFHELDRRALHNGQLSIGRDPSVEWVVSDPDCEVSRKHCVIAVADGALTLEDTSANGVYLGPERRRAPRYEAVRLDVSDAIHFGQFVIRMEHNTQDETRS